MKSEAMFNADSILKVHHYLLSEGRQHVGARTAANQLRWAIMRRTKDGWTVAEIHDVLSRSPINLSIDVIARTIRQEQRRLRRLAAKRAAKRAKPKKDPD